jgi:hypothetical protein
MAMAWQCGDTGECVCISWTTSGGATIEVRCPTGGSGLSGWATGGDPDNADGTRGSYSGSGQKQTPPSSLPGMPINSTTGMKLTPAKNEAIKRLKGDIETGDDGKPLVIPNKCSELFANSPMSSTTNQYPGAQLLGNYIIFRDGTGVKDAQNRDRCAEGVAAWTTCCLHDPVVFICPNQFNNASYENRIKYVIHEALHVAGQLEDGNGTTGPGDPPNSGQISSNVADACGGN